MTYRVLKMTLLIALTALPATFLPAAATAMDKEYAIPSLRVEAQVRADGTIRITEHYTYVFEGSFSWANRTLPIGGDAGYREIREVRISGPGGPFVNENSERPGTFLVRRSDDMIEFRWFFQAEDERRTFTLSYTLEGAVVAGPEWSEFFWTWLGGDREKFHDTLSLRLDLPRSVPADSLHHWSRGVRDRITVDRSRGSYRLTARDIDDHERVLLRTVFPTSVFNRDRVAVSDPGFSLASAREEERQYREEQEEREAYNAWLAGIGRQLAILLAVLSIGAFWFFYSRWGRRHPVTGTGSDRVSLVPPSREKPALVGWLLNNRTTTGGHLMATLLDLARRGYFRIREQPPEKEGWLGEKKPVFTLTSTGKASEGDLQPWEADMLDFVRAKLQEGESGLKELFKQHSSDFSRWFSGWKEQVQAQAFDKNWIDEESYTGAWYNAGVQGLLLMGAIACVYMAGPFGLVAALPAFTLAVASLGIIRRTREGEAVYQNWKGYKKALKEAEDHSVGHELDTHFIYAVALGSGKESIESLFKANPNQVSHFGWIVVLHSRSSPAALANTFQTLNATGTSAFGGAAGASGGASAGAAGGGGSAGAG